VKPLPVSTIKVDPKDIGATLKAMRKWAGLSQAEAARRAGFSSPATVSNYERGLRYMDPDKLNKILRAYGMVVATITFRKIDLTR
jgi:transcriptional regulator with XRE-family HTH domain